MPNIQNIINNNLCVSCAACCFKDGKRISTMVESKAKGIYIPIVNDENRNLTSICPGKGYSIASISNSLFGKSKYNDLELGRWDAAEAVHSNSDQILENAASGGIMTTIAKFALDKKIVTGVITTEFSYGDTGPRPKTFIATTFKELINSQGSKYCPVPALDIIDEIYQFEGKLLFIGTPCQVAAVRLLQEKNPELKEKILLTIANFCGGYRDFTETNKLIERAGFIKSSVEKFRYRGEGQPGSMLIGDGNKTVRLPYPNYARMTGVVKYLRCRTCVDATGELADFSCGDAWLDKYSNSSFAWSIVLARSPIAVRILNELKGLELITSESITSSEIKLSQKGNLITKKHRQDSRMKLYKLLGYSIPIYDGGYFVNNKGLFLELKVHISHSIFSFLEKIGLYKIISKFIGRYPKV
jgi:coenzyme F420 hydrogenase subunit beta